jgi:hypothetical protein
MTPRPDVDAVSQKLALELEIQFQDTSGRCDMFLRSDQRLEPPIYIGKESDRHWEEGDDLSLLEFKAIQYRPKGNAVANDEQLARIAKVPKREFMRGGINQHTLEKICRREPVRVAKLSKCLNALEEYERGKLSCSA